MIERFMGGIIAEHPTFVSKRATPTGTGTKSVVAPGQTQCFINVTFGGAARHPCRASGRPYGCGESDSDHVGIHRGENSMKLRM